MTELAGVMVGNYFLLECLGREGMVETYRARPTTRGGFDVMLRLFRPQFPDPMAFHDHFAAEVEKVWRCHHEHIQPLLEFGTGAELLYSATEWTEAETLEHYLERQQDQLLPIPFVLKLVVQLCEALQYVHERGIVHGNIQPSSILLQDEKHVLLTNFAMKRGYVEGEPVVAQIEEGNPAYVAPEQVVGRLGPASDIYAVGVLLYRLLDGRLPYEGDSPSEIVLRQANDPIPSLRARRPDVPEHLELVVRVALAKSPAARFASADDLAKALVSGIVPETAPVVSAVPQRRIAVQSRRTSFTWSRALSLLTLTSLLFGLAGTLFFVSSLPHGISDITGFPFGTGGWPGGSSLKPGSTAVMASATSPPPWEAGRPTAVHPTATSGSGGGLPGSKTPTPIRSSTPVIGATVPVNPIGTPIPTVAPFTCVAGTLAIDGSPNLEPLLQQVNNDYAASCPGLSFSLGGDGSRAALNYLQQGQIDLADTDLTANPARNLTDHPVAALLYALIVSSDVQVSGLSSAEIQDIYAGQITNWSQVGGPDEAITVIRHLPNDTINMIFRTFVLNGANEHVKKVKLKGDWASVVQAVAQMQGAISYVPLMMAENTNVQILAIDGAFPSVQAVISGSYSFWSVEHFYTQGDGTAQAQAYMQFFSSTQEENVLPQYGAVPIAVVPQGVLASHLPGPPGISNI